MDQSSEVSNSPDTELASESDENSVEFTSANTSASNLHHELVDPEELIPVINNKVLLETFEAEWPVNEKLRVFRRNAKTINSKKEEYHSRYKNISPAIKSQLLESVHLIESLLQKYEPDAADAEGTEVQRLRSELRETEAELDTAKSEIEHLSEQLNRRASSPASGELNTELSEIVAEELEQNKNEIEQLKSKLRRLENEKRPHGSSSSSQPNNRSEPTHPNIVPHQQVNRSRQTKPNNAWATDRRISKSKEDELTVVVVQPTGESEHELKRVTTEMRKRLEQFKCQVNFKALVQTKSNKAIVKFEPTEKEKDIVNELKKISGTRVWKSTRLVTIYVRDIESDFDEVTVLEEIANSNAIPRDQLKSAKMLQSTNPNTGKPYATKRAFIRMSASAYETLVAKRDLVIGYTCTKFNIAREPELICFHCGESGHRGYNRSNQQDGQPKRICKNSPKCLHCGEDHALHDCQTRNQTERKFCLRCRIAGHTALDSICPDQLKKKQNHHAATRPAHA